VFAAAVVLLAEGTRVALTPDVVPVVGGRPTTSLVLWVALAVVLVMPAVLHLTAALQTVLLIPVAPDRAGISETVQVIAYATAPCLFAGLPIPALRVACGVYGSVLLVIGVAEVHDLPLGRAAVVAAVPAAIVFGYGFRAFAAGSALLAALGPGTF
jgi:hypothetical protein